MIARHNPIYVRLHVYLICLTTMRTTSLRFLIHQTHRIKTDLCLHPQAQSQKMCRARCLPCRAHVQRRRTRFKRSNVFRRGYTLIYSFGRAAPRCGAKKQALKGSRSCR